MTNEPVAINGGLAVVAAIFTPLLARWGIDADGATKLFGLLGALITAALAILALLQARAKVTPVAAPKSDTGVALVPVSHPAVAPIVPPAPPVPPAV